MVIDHKFLKNNCNSKYWKMKQHSRRIWTLEHVDGHSLTVRLMPNGKFSLSVPMDAKEADYLGKKYYTYVCNPLVVTEMIAKQKEEPVKCSWCEKIKSFFKGSK